MIDIAITASILLVFAGIFLKGAHLSQNTDFFFSKEYTAIMKGLCCIVVVFVHIPSEHGNMLQDAVGSFAFVCVTLFFMMSAYGLRVSLVQRKDYLKRFWVNRILSVYIPVVSAGVLRLAVLLVLRLKILTLTSVLAVFMLSFSDFITYMIILYILFYFVYRYIRPLHCADVTMCIAAVSLSLISYWLSGRTSARFWPTEIMGFVYGIILAKHIDFFKRSSGKMTALKIFMSLTASLILGVTYLKFKDIGFWGDYVLKMFLGIAVILLLLEISVHFRFGNAVNRYLGRISYEVYLMSGTVVILALDHTIVGNVPSGPYISAAIAVTIISAACARWWDAKIIGRFKRVGQ